MSLYLDHAATSPVRPEARQAFDAWIDAANASAAHGPGQRARTAVEEARETVATALGCSPHDIVFTSGGTEADNVAIKGIVWAARERTRHVPHVVTTDTEHAAVRESARWLAERGDAQVTFVPPRADGTIDIEQVVAAIRPETALVSVMLANNEVGAVNDVAALGIALADRDIVLHTDAVQVFATRLIDVPALGVDALALSAHKFGGPQGVGVAMLRRGVGVVPLVHGGGQDRGVRSGTFAAALIAACGAAVTAATAQRDELAGRLQALSDMLSDGCCAVEGVRRSGPTSPDQRLVSHVHLMIDDVDATALSLELDRAGLAASSGSACSAGAATGSHVLRAMGQTGVPLRLSLGWTTTEEEITRAIDVLCDVVPRVRTAPVAFAPIGGGR